MAIKIPKLEVQPDVSLTRTNLLGATQDFVGPNMDKITDLLEKTAKEKYANDVRLETLRINNKISKYESLLADQNETLKKEIAEQPNVLNEKQLADKLKEVETKQKLFLKDAYKDDQNFQNAFDGHAITSLTNAKKILNDENKARLFVEAQNTWTTFEAKQEMEFKNIKPGFHMFEELKVKMAELDQKIRINQKAGIKIDHKAKMDDLRFEYWKKAVAGTNYRIDAQGVKVVDNLAVLKNLTDKGPLIEDAEGNIISGKQTHYYLEELDNEMRENLIKHYDDESTIQHNKELKVKARKIDDSSKAVYSQKDTITVDQVRLLDWGTSPEANQAMEDSIGMIILRDNKMLATSSNVTELAQIRKMIFENKILTPTDKFWLPHEKGREEELKKMKSIWTDEGASITARMGVTIGSEHTDMLNDRLAWDDTDRKNHADFRRLIDSVKGRILGVMHKHNLFAPYDLLKVEMMLEDRFLDGIRNGKTASQLTNPKDKDFIFTDIESFVKTVQQEAEQITQTFTSTKSDINTDGEVTKVEAPDSMPKRDMRIFPDDPDGNKAWIESEILNKWIWKDYPNNTVMSEDAASFLQDDITAPVISNEYYEKDKKKRMETANTLVEKDAIDLGIDYELVPPMPKGFKGKVFTWVKKYKDKHKDAITLFELEKIVKEEKLKRYVPPDKGKRGVLNSDGKSRIEKKILDGNPAFDEKDGIYYWKGTDIEVDITTIK